MSIILNECTPRTPAPSPTDECAGISKSTTKLNRFKVVIIGAGIAGLSAANHLIQNGCSDICILEGRSRIGGRIASVPLDKHKIELGANWIHGILGNPMFEIAVQHGLVSVLNVPKPHKVVATTKDGAQVPFSILQEICEAYVCFLRRCDEYFLCQYSPPADISSVGEHMNYEIQIYLNSIENPKEKHLKQLIFNCLLKRETCITGCNDMKEIDLLELGSYTELQGGNIVLPEGYSSILQPLSAQIPKNVTITKCPVKKIYWKRKASNTDLDIVNEDYECEYDSDNSVSTFTNDHPQKTIFTGKQSSIKTEKGSNCSVRIICEGNRTYYAEHVICTIPLGVLKNNHKSLFHPELPQYKQECIERLLFGTVNKIYLEYDRPFLNKDITEIMLLWDEDDCDIQNNQENDSVEFMNKNWFKKIYSFAKVTDTLLLGWVSGYEAEYMETLTAEVVADKCTEILRSFLQDPFVPKPKRCVCTNWKSQPFTMGSYTSIPVGASQEDIEHLAQPLFSSPTSLKPIIVFAGEHTHSNFYSTVHGAYLSGRTAAQRLLSNEETNEIILQSDGSDLNSWLQGISLD